VVDGYKGSNDAFLAMQRGEVHGVGSSSLTNLKTTQADLLNSKQIRIIGQYGLSPNADLPGVPTVMDLVTDPDQRDAFRLVLTRQEIGRVLLAPPDVPADIIAAYRAAFDKTMLDKEFREEVAKRAMDYDPQNAAQIEQLVADLYTASPAVVEKVKGILGGRN
jgi:hypothetical protein